MPKGFRKDGSKLGFQKEHKINVGRIPWDKDKKNPGGGRCKGYKCSKETIEKMKIALKGKKSWNKGKKCFQLSGQNNGMWGKTHTKKVKEKLRKYFSEHNKGSQNPNWKGGRKNHVGYILIKKRNHPFADDQGYVFEHRLIMEKCLGRYLKPEERVHHINEIINDNRIENLMLFKSNSEHTIFHHALH